MSVTVEVPADPPGASHVTSPVVELKETGVWSAREDVKAQEISEAFAAESMRLPPRVMLLPDMGKFVGLTVVRLGHTPRVVSHVEEQLTGWD